MTAVRYWLALAMLCALVAISSGAGSIASAQDDETPAIEATRSARVQTEETPESDISTSDSDSSADEGESTAPSPNSADIEITGADQTIAQGLAAFDAFPTGIWRITELKPLAVDEAPTVTAPYYGFLYQMAGTTIVRNDVTGKRARLEPGEAYYYSAGDSYTRYREEDVSRAWLIEIVPDDASNDDAAGTVIFTTGEIGSFPDDTRDFELMAANVPVDGTASVPDYEADALIMVTVGSLQVTDSEATVRMDAPAAMLVTGELELENTSGDPANYLIAKIGPSVGDALPVVDDEATADEPADDSGDAAADDPYLDTDGDTLIDTDEAVYGTDPTVPDTDGDGYIDGEEVIVYETDPLDSTSYP
jgi:hypothetical protein